MPTGRAQHITDPGPGASLYRMATNILSHLRYRAPGQRLVFLGADVSPFI
jgi:hypothetical protein